MNNVPRVVVTDLIPEPLECERRVLNGDAQVVALNIKHQAELNGQLDNADAVMIYHYLRLSREQIERLRQCKVIVRPGVGYDNIDIAAARERGIPVCNVPDYGTEEVADSALGMAVSLARGAHFLNSRLRRGIGKCYKRHRQQEFLKFLKEIDAQVVREPGVQIHIIMDNYGTHKTPTVKRWFDRHPEYHLHFTPTSGSWLNQVAQSHRKQDPLNRSIRHGFPRPGLSTVVSILVE